MGATWALKLEEFGRFRHKAIGRIAKWAYELGAHDIEFQPRTAIKTQALVDFESEWTEQQVPDNPETAEVWQMYFDGSLKL
jgi:ribonuclease HI